MNKVVQIYSDSCQLINKLKTKIGQRLDKITTSTLGTTTRRIFISQLGITVLSTTVDKGVLLQLKRIKMLNWNNM